MEDKEEEIRRRWFESQQNPGQEPSLGSNNPRAIILRDGQPITNVDSGPSLPPKPSNGALNKGDGASTADPICDAELERVMEGRERFRRHQCILDGDLVASCMPIGGPVTIVEDLVDCLIDEILYEEAKRMTSLCDEMGDKLYDEEFVDP